MHSDTLLQRAHRGRPTLLPRVALGATAGLLALAIAGPVQAAPPVRAQVHDGVLRVTGTPFSDAIRLSLAVGDPSTLNVFVNNNSTADFSFADASLSAIVLDGAGGDDRLSVDTSNGAFPDAQQIIVSGGAGDDEVFGGLGHQVLLGGRGNDKSTATRAPTISSAARVMTSSSGIRATPRTWPTVAPASTRCSSTAAVRARSSTPSSTMDASRSRATSATSSWT